MLFVNIFFIEWSKASKNINANEECIDPEFSNEKTIIKWTINRNQIMFIRKSVYDKKATIKISGKTTADK